MKLKIKYFMLLTVSTIVMAAGIYFFKFPNNFTFGGITGLAVLVAKTGLISASDFSFLANILLLILGLVVLGKGFAAKTAYCTILLSVALSALERIYPLSAPLTDEPMLELVFAIALPSVGSAILFNVGASSGGTDVVVMVARKRWGVDIGSMSFYINVVILFASFVVVDIEKILMGGLLLYVETVTIDRVLKSFDRRSQVLIISKRTQNIADFILKELDRSATVIPAKGAYSDRPHDMLLVVLTRRQTVDLRRYIAEIDPEAFLIFSDVTEVVGLGFKNWE